MKNFKGRVAVVTGGANGIGLGLARRFLAEGMKVVIADVNVGDLDKAVSELQKDGDVLGHRTDVSDAAQVQSLADAAVKHFGAVHVLCNNAGVGGFQRFGNTNAATWEWTLGVNLWGVIYGCRIFLPILEKQDEAHIVNTASMAAFLRGPYQHPYNVAKAGVVALTEGMWREFATEKPHIGLSVLCPAHTKTAIATDERNAPAGHIRRSETDPDLEAFRQATYSQLERGTTPEESAEAVMKAIRNRELYVFSEPEWIPVIGELMDGIVSGHPIQNLLESETLMKLISR